MAKHSIYTYEGKLTMNPSLGDSRRVIQCCYKCTKRTKDCHTRCVRYKVEKYRQNLENQKAKEFAKVEREYMSYVQGSAERIRNHADSSPWKSPKK